MEKEVTEENAERGGLGQSCRSPSVCRMSSETAFCCDFSRGLFSAQDVMRSAEKGGGKIYIFYSYIKMDSVFTLDARISPAIFFYLVRRRISRAHPMILQTGRIAGLLPNTRDVPYYPYRSSAANFLLLLFFLLELNIWRRKNVWWRPSKEKEEEKKRLFWRSSRPRWKEARSTDGFPLFDRKKKSLENNSILV